MGNNLVEINWKDYKEYKKSQSGAGDNFTILINFLQNYYSMVSVKELYETLSYDELANMMLEKKNISDVIALETYLFNKRG